MQSLEIALLSHDSATLVLDDWCALHRLAPPGTKIVAERVKDVDRQASAAQRQDLGVSATEAIRYRRVRLRCGAHVLSEADNWYVPSRLAPAMNDALDHGDTAFGRVVQPLHFHRQTLSAKLLWSPPPGPDRPAAPIAIPPAIIENRGLLLLADGTPISEVIETYTSETLAFGPAG
jgi:hypothetical protein